MPPSIEQLECQLESGNLSISDLLSLRRRLEAPFKLHPLGFVACTLISDGTRKVRLHYWPLTGGAQQSPEHQIHNHIFEFRSWIFAGSVENVEYITSQEGKEFALYQTEYFGSQSTIIKTNTTLRLAERDRRTFSAGTSYSMQAGVLHETFRVGDEPAFTALVTNEVSNAAPLVFGPLDGLDRYVYSRDIIDETFVEALIAGA
jgi:hypothetical protein